MAKNNSMLKLPFFSRQKLLLAFEYGLTIQRVAYENKVEMTQEIVARAEKIVANEFKTQSATFLATNMVPIILAIFEVDTTK